MDEPDIRPSWGGARVHSTTLIDVAEDGGVEQYETPFGYLIVWKVDGKSRDGIKGKAGTSRMFHRRDCHPPQRMGLRRKHRSKN
tara:strand:+ start:330 stop:581 length:252 start_codon:yes stop_codon:yes gene_type:complete